MTGAIALVVALCAPGADDVLLGERVVLVADDDSALTTRTQDELEALGLMVVRRSHTELGSDVLTAARGLAANAVVDVQATTLDIWSDLDGVEPHVAHVGIDSGGNDDDFAVLALRCAELVRVQLLAAAAAEAARRPVADRASGTVAPAEPAHGEDPAPLAHDAADDHAPRAGGGLAVAATGAIAVHGVVGVPVSPRVEARVCALIGPAAWGLSASVPTVASTLAVNAGTLDVRFADVTTFGSWQLAHRAPVDVSLVADVGASWFRGSGRNAVTGAVIDGDLVLATASVGAIVGFEIAGPLSLVTELRGGALAPMPVVDAGAQGVALGPLWATANVGVRVAWPAS